MKWEQRRLLEMAGILRRSDLLTEGDDDGGGDDLFGDDSGGDDSGGDDLFGGGDDDSGGDDAGGDDAGGEAEEDAAGSNREPPEALKPEDIKKFGSPRFLDVQTKITSMFNDAMKSASVGAQELEAYPGNAIEPTPAKNEEPEEDEELEEDEEEVEDEDAEDEGDEEEEKNESFYRYGNRRDKWLINEARRLLREAEEEGAAADEFDMEGFCTELANYMDNIHNTQDVEAGIFNTARQMILNNFGQQTEQEFIDMLASVSGDKWSFLQTGFEGDPDRPVAVGASAGGGGV
jgi:molecular chaperone GrpE (heat shock protein)